MKHLFLLLVFFYTWNFRFNEFSATQEAIFVRQAQTAMLHATHSRTDTIANDFAEAQLRERVRHTNHSAKLARNGRRPFAHT